MPMEVFRNLFIRGTRDQRALLLDAIDGSLCDGWTRDRATEQEMRALPPRAEFMRCYAYAGDGRNPAATLFLTEAGRDTLSIPNIVPRERGRLSYGQYNGLVTDFFERFVQPHADKAGVTAELTEVQADLEHWLSHDAAEKLRRFSRVANRGTGASHPSDRQRWLEFLVTAYQEGNHLDAVTLQRWLIEIEGWPPEVACQLAVEYEFGGELIAFVGQRRGA